MVFLCQKIAHFVKILSKLKIQTTKRRYEPTQTNSPRLIKPKQKSFEMEESKQQPQLPIHEDTPEAEREQQENQTDSRTVSQQMAEA